ncbi:CrcB family protein [Haloplanus aerogenes]|uniref:Fluoride-specific ion channel FluC n=1 Tax=Haloplanus aerogenes TaxID=660522 RepID=A0A3M0DQG8_9EURY|nr:CrcB family protein [Haloplanus aerogenes]AZH24542.1 chromosome condensation protein CrcB [Haloplanus aerogenes]RMB23804.1 protein CrcB [Haloplanus aerogenes]
MQRRDWVYALETGLLIAVGGAAGANLRYAIGTVLPGLQGTLVANVTGSFLLGVLLYEALYTDLLAEKTRVVFGTGFLSSYTTYSTFAVESTTVPLWLGFLNVVGSYALGIVAVLAGRRLVVAFTETGGSTDG